MVLGGLFILVVINTKAERAGGWGNYAAGCVGLIVFMVVLGVLGKGCKAVFGS